MRLRRVGMLVVLALVIVCLGLAACAGYSPVPNNGGGTPAPTSTSSGY